jgi:hypothetical protein
MAQARLFTVTHWLLNAAMLFCIFGAAILFLALGGLAVIGTGLWVPAEIPALLEGVPRSHVMLIAAMAVLAGIAILVLAILIFRAIQQIVVSATGGDPFVARNADRLARVGWLLVGIYVVQFVMHAAMGVMVPVQLKNHLKFDGLGFDFSPLGVLAILLVFVLEGTV